MNLLASTVAMLALAASSATALAGDTDAVSFGQRLADRNCTWCHGPSAQGFTTAPRLAGQKRQYLENQLLSFKTHVRDNPLSAQYMWAAAGPISHEAARSLADYLSRLDAQSANDGDQSLAATGEAIYRQGIPRSNIPACVACHGPNAEGVSAIPRLGGLSYYYLKRKLQQWGEGYHAAAMRPMPEVASKLSDNDIEALASYLSFVR